MNGTFSTWREVFLGVPQGAVLGSLLSNINFNDIFIFAEETEMCNFVDDTTTYAHGAYIENVIERLEHDAPKLTEWLPNNPMKLDEDKGHFNGIWCRRRK